MCKYRVIIFVLPLLVVHLPLVFQCTLERAADYKQLYLLKADRKETAIFVG